MRSLPRSLGCRQAAVPGPSADQIHSRSLRAPIEPALTPEQLKQQHLDFVRGIAASHVPRDMEAKGAFREDLNSMVRRVLPSPDENQLFDWLHAALCAPPNRIDGFARLDVQARENLFDTLCGLAKRAELPTTVIDRLIEAHTNDRDAFQGSPRNQMYFLAFKQIYRHFIANLITNPAKPDIFQACLAELHRLLGRQRPLEINVHGLGRYVQHASRDVAIQALMGWLKEIEIWPALKSLFTIDTVPPNPSGKQADLALRACAIHAALRTSSAEASLDYIKACLKPVDSVNDTDVLRHSLDIRATCIEILLGRLQPALLKAQAFEFFLSTLHAPRPALAEAQIQRALFARIFIRTVHELPSDIAHKAINALLRRLPSWPDQVGWHDLAQVLPHAFRALLVRLDVDTRTACVRALRDDNSFEAVQHDAGALAPRCLALAAVYMDQPVAQRLEEINAIFVAKAKATANRKGHVPSLALMHQIHLIALILPDANIGDARRLRFLKHLIAIAMRAPLSARTTNQSLCRVALSVLYSTLPRVHQHHLIENVLTSPTPDLWKILEAAALISDTHPMSSTPREFGEVLECAIASVRTVRAAVKGESEKPDSPSISAELVDRLRGKFIAWLARCHADIFAGEHLASALKLCAVHKLAADAEAFTQALTDQYEVSRPARAGSLDRKVEWSAHLPAGQPIVHELCDYRAPSNSLDWLEVDVRSALDHLPIATLRRLGPTLLQAVARSDLPYDTRASLIAHLVGVHAEGDVSGVSKQTKRLYAMARTSLMPKGDSEGVLADHIHYHDSKAKSHSSRDSQDSQESQESQESQDFASDGSLDDSGSSGSIRGNSLSRDERSDGEDPPSPRPRPPIDMLSNLRYASRHLIALTNLAASMPSDYWTAEAIEENRLAIRAAQIPLPERNAILGAMASLPTHSPAPAAGLDLLARWCPLPLRHALQSLLAGGQAV